MTSYNPHPAKRLNVTFAKVIDDRYLDLLPMTDCLLPVNLSDIDYYTDTENRCQYFFENR